MKKSSDQERRKPRKEASKAKASGNKRLTEQTRKLLSKHYASKYRAR